MSRCLQDAPPTLRSTLRFVHFARLLCTGNLRSLKEVNEIISDSTRPRLSRTYIAHNMDSHFTGGRAVPSTVMTIYHHDNEHILHYRDARDVHISPCNSPNVGSVV